MPELPIIPGYDLIHQLGGRRSLVYRAREWGSGDDVALKFASHQIPEVVSRLLLAREARAGLAVRHVYLVHIRAAQLSQEPRFVVMDLLPGEPLRAILDWERRLEIPAALRVARQIAEALAALHRAGFVHGDVKPENVQCVDAENAVLLDLGFSHRPDENQLFAQQNLVLGTANYLAPERCGADPGADERSDIFSLGIMLFEMLTGTLPYSTGTIPETLRTHRHGIAADLRDFPGDWPWALIRLLQRMLAFRPGDRPPATILSQELLGLEIREINGTGRIPA
jgi:serine/threonine protein kinase